MKQSLSMKKKETRIDSLIKDTYKRADKKAEKDWAVFPNSFSLKSIKFFIKTEMKKAYLLGQYSGSEMAVRTGFAIRRRRKA